MTVMELLLRLVEEIAKNPKIQSKHIRIEHRNCDDDDPEDVGVYPYHNRVGLSFWRD